MVARIANTRAVADKKATPKAPQLDTYNGEEHRRFPRARMEVAFKVWIGDEDEPTFSATLKSTNISVSGAFLQTTFFLPVETTLNMRFSLEGNGAVEGRAEIIREERPGGRNDSGRSGIGIKFIEFFNQTEVGLARLFLEEQLAAFVKKYLSSARARSLNDETERMIDAVAAWELRKVTEQEKDPWRTTMDDRD